MVPECDRSPEMDELVCGLAIELMLRNGINGPNSDELRRRKNQEILRITNKIAQLKNIDRQPCGGA